MKTSMILPLAIAALLSACANRYTGPVEVTRFNAGPAAPLGQGTIAVVPAPGDGPPDLRFAQYARAVEGQLARLGYTVVPNAGAARQQAELRFDRADQSALASGRNPVSVGVGGSTGTYGSGLGLGLGLNLGGGPRPRIANQLAVVIRDAAGQSIWEGRAEFVASDNSDAAPVEAAAARMADALFRDFPGNSGESVTVR